MSISIKPDPLSFGCVSEGFVYKLKVFLSNHGKGMDRFRIEVSPDSDSDPNTLTCDYKISNIAPGVGSSFTLELRAISSFQTTFTLVVTRASSKESISLSISALVIPREVFKKVAKSLMLRNKGIYATGVRCFGQLSGEIGAPSIVSGAPTIYSEALIDDEELDELVDLPILPQNYWDPYKKLLIVDSELCKVVTSPEWTVEKSKEETAKYWELRLEELEVAGMVTSRILERLINEKHNRSAVTTMPQSMSIPEMFSSALYSGGPSQNMEAFETTTP